MPHMTGMKHISYSFLILVVWAGAAQAACFADYKAKRDDPLRLHYGVVAVAGDCSVANATKELTVKLAADDWQLLTVLGVFDDTALMDRKETAGDYYLRY
jgi:hypothetical protein